MKNTFKSWLIANLEAIAEVIAVSLTIVLILCLIKTGEVFSNSESVSNSENGSNLILCLFVASVGLTMPGKGIRDSLTALGVGLFLLAIPLLIVVDKGLISITSLCLWGAIIAITAIIPAIYIAKFAYNNVEEVLSRRFFYRNSKVNYLEFKVKYAIERFITSWRCIMAIGLFVFLLTHLNLVTAFL